MAAERRGEMDLKFAKWEVSPSMRKEIYDMVQAHICPPSIERKAGREQEPGECQRGSNGGGRATSITMSDARERWG